MRPQALPWSGPDLDAALARADAVEPWLHAFVWLDPERTLAAAGARSGSGALAGVPVGVKDIVDTEGIPTERGSPLFSGRVPQASAQVVLRLESAGGIVLGKTVTAELAFYHPGPTVNPYDPSRTPGGSSMGSAAAVAAGVVPLAIGTQTNGSVIRPAAFCGVVGFKPSAGSIPGAGIMPFSPTLDQVGVFARSVDDAARFAAVLAGLSERAWAPRPVERPRLAVAPTSDWDRAEPAARARFEADIAALATAGAQVERPALPDGLDEAASVLRTIMYVEGSRSLGEHVRSRPELVSAVLRGLVEEGAGVRHEEHVAALRERDRLRGAFDAWARGYDAVLTLPAAGEAPPRETTGDPRYCSRWQLVGAPALTIPTGLGPSRLPLGLQLVGAPGTDLRVSSVAAWAESVLPRIPAPAVR